MLVNLNYILRQIRKGASFAKVRLIAAYIPSCFPPPPRIVNAVTIPGLTCEWKVDLKEVVPKPETNKLFLGSSGHA